MLMFEDLGSGIEDGIKYNVIWKYDDYVHITCENTGTGEIINTIHKCAFRPVFGIDVSDMEAVKKLLERDINKLKAA